MAGQFGDLEAHDTIRVHEKAGVAAPALRNGDGLRRAESERLPEGRDLFICDWLDFHARQVRAYWRISCMEEVRLPRHSPAWRRQGQRATVCSGASRSGTRPGPIPGSPGYRG